MPRHDFVCVKDGCLHYEKDVVLIGTDDTKWEIPKHCRKPMEISYINLDVPISIFEAFDTRNIHPDAKRIHIGSRGDLAWAAREYGVRHVDDPNLVAEGGEIRRKGPSAPSAFVDMGSRR